MSCWTVVKSPRAVLPATDVVGTAGQPEGGVTPPPPVGGGGGGAVVWAVKVSVFGLARWPPAGAPIVTVQLVPAAPTLNGIVCDCPASIMIPPEFDEHP